MQPGRCPVLSYPGSLALCPLCLQLLLQRLTEKP